jgi:hypothetical protein
MDGDRDKGSEPDLQAVTRDAGRLEDQADELQEGMDKLESHIDDAHGELQKRKEAAVRPGGEVPGEEIAGDWEGEGPTQGATPSEAGED